MGHEDTEFAEPLSLQRTAAHFPAAFRPKRFHRLHVGCGMPRVAYIIRRLVDTLHALILGKCTLPVALM
jgi:hypothetical protein